MTIKKTDIVYYTTYAYLLFNFFILADNSFSRFIDLLYFVLMAFFIALHLAKNKIKITNIEFCFIILFGGLIITQFFLSQYGISDVLKTTIVFFIAYFICNTGLLIDNNNRKRKDILYFITISYLIFFLIKSYYDGSLLSNTTSMANNFYLQSLGDKNLSAIVMFLFFYFCYKKRYILGIIISAIYMFFLGSRMLYIGIAIFVFVEVIKKYKVLNINLIKKNILLLIIISQAMVWGISYYVTFNVSTNEVSTYKEGLMDSSNAMRARSNVYAAETIKKNIRFIIHGYDSKILDVLGVSDRLHSSSYLGYRLVQPHSLLLNLMLRYGILYSIIYMLSVSYLIKKMITRENVSLFATYLFMNMILHLMFSGLYLLFFIFDMKMEPNPK